MLIEKLRRDALQARKDKDAVASGLLVTLVSEAEMAGKNKHGSAFKGAMADDEVIPVVRKFLKNAAETRDVLAKAPDAGERLQVAEREIALLEGYLPRQMGDEDLRKAIEHFLKHNPGVGMGGVMKFLKDEHAGTYDGKRASAIAKEMIG